MIKRHAPWLILAFFVALTAMLIVLYSMGTGVFGGPPALAVSAPGAAADQPPGIAADQPPGIAANPLPGAAANPLPGAITANRPAADPTSGTAANQPPGTAAGQNQPAQPSSGALLPAQMRGVWIATVINIDFPKNTAGGAAAQQQELLDILDTTQDAGLNTIFFQVRPQGDALYRSQIFPWSQYLTGVAGQDPGYDPLDFLLSEAHQRGIAVHAWINPFRLSMGNKDNPLYHEALPANSPVKARPDLTLAAGDGRLYLNPGEPEAVALVLAGVREILENYPVDGIHLDDYFYPDAAYDDAAAYQKYGGALSLADWRRANTAALIREIQALVRETRPEAAFGVSPSGIWRNAKNTPLGSDTNGFESYSQIYADTRQWVKDGLLDYIAPQLYWAIGKEGSDYKLLLQWWGEVCADSGVRLYVGHGAYRLGASKEQAWQSSAEIGRQLELNKSLGITGSIFYGYKQIRENTLGLRDLLRSAW